MKIFELYSDLGADWILLGKGEMTYKGNYSRDDTSNFEKQLKNKGKLVDHYKKLIDENDARNELLENLIHAFRIKSTKSDIE